jgi:hypothetical protein
MTDDRLNLIEALLRNPPSNGILAELGLELLEELRAMRATAPVVVDTEKLPVLTTEPKFGFVEALHATKFDEHDLDPHDKPTPPMGVVIDDRPEPKKKGKR